MTEIVGAAALVALLVLAAIAWRVRRSGRPRPEPRSRRIFGTGPGAGAAGAFYELLDRDRRAAIEIVIEERAVYRDPEDRDGDLPQLESPKDGVGRRRS